jgi:UDP-glucuronate 4-epimerase
MLTNVLITGGAGFIGSSLADRLLEQNFNVIVVDNFSDYYSPEIKRNNIKEALKDVYYKISNNCCLDGCR